MLFFIATNTSWQKTQIFEYGCFRAVIFISPIWCSMVQSGAAWCRVVQYFLLRSEFVADMLLEISGIHMSNKRGAKHAK